MKSAAVILLACLLFVDVKGMVISPRGRCHCMDAGVKFIPPKQIEKIEVYPPSSSCQHMEIIATLKEGGELKCLNPESRFAKNFIKAAQRKRGAKSEMCHEVETSIHLKLCQCPREDEDIAPLEPTCHPL